MSSKLDDILNSPVLLDVYGEIAYNKYRKTFKNIGLIPLTWNKLEHIEQLAWINAITEVFERANY